MSRFRAICVSSALLAALALAPAAQSSTTDGGAIPTAKPQKARYLPTVLGLTAWNGRPDPTSLHVNWVAGIRVVWSDVVSKDGSYHWDDLDHRIEAIQNEQSVAIPVFVPRPPGSDASKPLGVPADLEAWEGFVKRVIERYDGDGKDDMPGLTLPIRNWQAMPDLISEWKATSFQTVSYLETTHRAIASGNPRFNLILGSITDSDVDLLQIDTGGLTGTYIGGKRMTRGVIRAVTELRDRLEKLESVLKEGGESFQTVDVRHLTSGPRVAEQLRFLASYLKDKSPGPHLIWSLYNAVPSIPEGMPDEPAIASELVRTALLSLVGGCHRFAWPADGQQLPSATTVQIYPFVDRDGKTHLSQQTFTELARRLEGLEKLEVWRFPASTPSVVLIHAVSSTEAPFVVAWNNVPDEAETVFAASGPVTAKNAVDGREQTYQPEKGLVKIPIGPYPVYLSGISEPGDVGKAKTGAKGSEAPPAQ